MLEDAYAKPCCSAQHCCLHSVDCPCLRSVKRALRAIAEATGLGSAGGIHLFSSGVTVLNTMCICENGINVFILLKKCGEFADVGYKVQCIYLLSVSALRYSLSAHCENVTQM